MSVSSKNTTHQLNLPLKSTTVTLFTLDITVGDGRQNREYRFGLHECNAFK